MKSGIGIKTGGSKKSDKYKLELRISKGKASSNDDFPLPSDSGDGSFDLAVG